MTTSFKVILNPYSILSFIAFDIVSAQAGKKGEELLKIGLINNREPVQELAGLVKCKMPCVFEQDQAIIGHGVIHDIDKHEKRWILDCCFTFPEPEKRSWLNEKKTI